MHPGRDGWIAKYEYKAGARRVIIWRAARWQHVANSCMSDFFIRLTIIMAIRHLEAAAASIDVHNGASAWNKSLLDNAARPSGALSSIVDQMAQKT